MNAREISQLLAQKSDEISKYLLPNGKKEGNEWRVGSINGEQGRSLGVHLTGTKAGLWCDFNAGQKGDLIDLWAITRSISISEAIREAKNYLGISTPSFHAHKPKSFEKPNITNDKPLQSNSLVTNYLVNDRKLTIETLNRFKVTENNNDIVFNYFRNKELIFAKTLKLERSNNKKKMFVESNCEPCLYGWDLIPDNAREIIICEGEIDAISLHQYGHAALSVPFGGGGGDKQKWIEYEFDRLAIFDVIYLCFDPDESGQAAINEIIDRLGRHRCRIISLPYKDPNECLQNNVTKETINKCINEAENLDPEELKSAREFVGQVIDEFYPPPGKILGYYAPWDITHNKIMFRPDELSVWTGINGHGKSQFLGQIILGAMQQGAKVCIASLELKPRRLLMRLTRQASASSMPSRDHIFDIHRWYEDKLWLFDLVGTAKSKRLLDVFLYARQRYGIDIFVIDSFMKLDIAEDDYKAQKSFIEQLCDFKNQHNCHIHIVVHPRKSLDESKSPGKLDNKGTGAITDLADNCFAVWRNKKKETLIELKKNGVTLDANEQEILKQADCFWICDKQRNGDWEGKFGFWFNQESYQYLNKNTLPAPLIGIRD